MGRGPRTIDLATEPPWTHTETHPGGIKVVVEEWLPRRRRLYLRWREDGNWRKQALGEERQFGRCLRDDRGYVDENVAMWAVTQAKRKCLELAGDPSAAQHAAASSRPAVLTLGGTKAVLTDANTGPYPHDTSYRRELLRALAYAIRVWGSERTWVSVDTDALTLLWRQRVRELHAKGTVGIRGTEVTMQRVMTIASQLHLKGHLRSPLTMGRTWKQSLRDYWRGLTGAERDPEPHRPRHTEAELRRILTASEGVDPRMHLLLVLGAELRLGQVRRSMRRDLDLEQGTLAIAGRGKKKGAVIDLTAGQLSVVTAVLETGYLADLETRYQVGDLPDFPLFLGGHFLGRKAGHWRVGKGAKLTRPVSREWVHENFHAAERAAKVPVIRLRGAYGLRRVAVDAALNEGISEAGLQAAGGWSDVKIPHSVYRDNENKAGRAEAAKVRAKVRGEGS